MGYQEQLAAVKKLNHAYRCYKSIESLFELDQWLHVYIAIPAKKKSLIPLITRTDVGTSAMPKHFTPMWYKIVAIIVMTIENVMPSFFIVDSSIVAYIVLVVIFSYELTSFI